MDWFVGRSTLPDDERATLAEYGIDTRVGTTTFMITPGLDLQWSVTALHGFWG